MSMLSRPTGDVHPISLEQVFFTRTVVIAIPDHERGESTTMGAPENTIDVTAMQDSPRRYLATMRTVLNQAADPQFPYSIDMECLGIFAADETLSVEDALRGVTITAHSVLYGAIRESVSWITGRHPYGPVSLGLSILRPQQNGRNDD